MRSSMLVALLSSIAFPLAAQVTAAPSGDQPMVVRAPSACPVGLRADRRAGVISREVDGKVIPTGQGVFLHFMSPPARRVIAADITVYGYSGGVIAQPLNVNSAKEISEEFHLTGSATEPLLQSAIWTAKIHGITAVELTRVTFSDGATWQRSAPSECRIEPSLFVLVK